MKAIAKVTVEREDRQAVSAIVQVEGSVVNTLPGRAFRRAHEVLVKQHGENLYGWKKMEIELWRRD